MRCRWNWGDGETGTYAEMLASMSADGLDRYISEKRREVARVTRELRCMEKELAARKVRA